jgi:hypothetical protein
MKPQDASGSGLQVNHPGQNYLFLFCRLEDKTVEICRPLFFLKKSI